MPMQDIVLPSTMAALWYLGVGGASGCFTALQGIQRSIIAHRRWKERRREVRDVLEERTDRQGSNVDIKSVPELLCSDDRKRMDNLCRELIFT
jgi:hypothetical protein